MDHKGLRILLMVHGFITLAAGIVLAVAPGLIPSVVGIHFEPRADRRRQRRRHRPTEDKRRPLRKAHQGRKTNRPPPRGPFDLRQRVHAAREKRATKLPSRS
jgi:hypothetical protein